MYCRASISGLIGEQFYRAGRCIHPANSIVLLWGFVRRLIRRLHLHIVGRIDNNLLTIDLVGLEVSPFCNSHCEAIGVRGIDYQTQLACRVATGSNHHPHRRGVVGREFEGSLHIKPNAIHTVADGQRRVLLVAREGAREHKVCVGNSHRRSGRVELHILNGASVRLSVCIAEFEFHNAINASERQLYGTHNTIYGVGLRLHHPQIFKVRVVAHRLLSLHCGESNGGKVIYTLARNSTVGVVGRENHCGLARPAVGIEV